MIAFEEIGLHFKETTSEALSGGTTLGQNGPRNSAPRRNAFAQLVKLCAPQCARLKRLVFAELGELTSSWHQNTNCCTATVVCLDAKDL